MLAGTSIKSEKDANKWSLVLGKNMKNYPIPFTQISIVGSDPIPSALSLLSCFIFGSTVWVCQTRTLIKNKQRFRTNDILTLNRLPIKRLENALFDNGQSHPF